MDANLSIPSLFRLADGAKSRGQYKIANIIFMYLARLALDGQADIDWYIECENSELFPGYFDLFVLTNQKKGWYLNIPVPLVNRKKFPEFFRAEPRRFRKRNDHARMPRRHSAAGAKNLRIQLRDTLGDLEIAKASACIETETRWH